LFLIIKKSKWEPYEAFYVKLALVKRFLVKIINNPYDSKI
jgi:hypothetical protein